jgi:folylpolyglutamate synthase/dihydropteroate synthase
LLAFHTFIREEVEAVIFETHHGGEYDTTKAIPSPVVTGITSLGMDHVDQLGPTLTDIAWHKMGTFKRGVPAFSVPQDPGLVGDAETCCSERNRFPDCSSRQFFAEEQQSTEHSGITIELLVGFENLQFILAAKGWRA